MIAVIDYKMGNLRSVANAIELLGRKAVITNNQDEIRQATHLILPGVGAFGEGMKNLENLGLIEFLKEQVINQKKPFMGICLGMQLLADLGTEFGCHEGLGWIPGEVKKMDSGNLPLPHVGWNNLSFPRTSPLFRRVNENSDFYFVHSYHFAAQLKEDVIAVCDYAQPFSAAINRENIYGVQFHPEKSQKAGRILLENFIAL